jgi:hypothetical protein
VDASSCVFQRAMPRTIRGCRDARFRELSLVTLVYIATRYPES